MRRVKRRSRARPRLTPQQAAIRAIELLLDCPHLLPRAHAAWLLAHLTREGDDALLAHWRRHLAAPVLAGRCSFCDSFVADRGPKQHLPKMFEPEEREYDV